MRIKNNIKCKVLCMVFVCQKRGKEKNFSASLECSYFQETYGIHYIQFSHKRSVSCKIFPAKIDRKVSYKIVFANQNFFTNSFFLNYFLHSKLLHKSEYLKIYNSKNRLVVRHFILILTINESVIC